MTICASRSSSSSGRSGRARDARPERAPAQSPSLARSRAVSRAPRPSVRRQGKSCIKRPGPGDRQPQTHLLRRRPGSHQCRRQNCLPSPRRLLPTKTGPALHRLPHQRDARAGPPPLPSRKGSSGPGLWAADEPRRGAGFYITEYLWGTRETTGRAARPGACWLRLRSSRPGGPTRVQLRASLHMGSDTSSGSDRWARGFTRRRPSLYRDRARPNRPAAHTARPAGRIEFVDQSRGRVIHYMRIESVDVSAVTFMRQLGAPGHGRPGVESEPWDWENADQIFRGY